MWKDVRTYHNREVFVESMDRRGRLVAMRGVPTMLGGEESVLDMGLGSERSTGTGGCSGVILHIATESRIVVHGVLKKTCIHLMSYQCEFIVVR